MKNTGFFIAMQPVNTVNDVVIDPAASALVVLPNPPASSPVPNALHAHHFFSRGLRSIF
jgi:hypothetical protein